MLSRSGRCALRHCGAAQLLACVVSALFSFPDTICGTHVLLQDDAARDRSAGRVCISTCLCGHVASLASAVAP